MATAVLASEDHVAHEVAPYVDNEVDQAVCVEVGNGGTDLTVKDTTFYMDNEEEQTGPTANHDTDASVTAHDIALTASDDATPTLTSDSGSIIDEATSKSSAQPTTKAPIPLLSESTVVFETTWTRFEGFTPDPKADFLTEFARLAKHQGWDNDDRKYWKPRLLEAEFGSFYGTNEKSLANWQELCRVCKIKRAPNTIKDCKMVYIFESRCCIRTNDRLGTQERDSEYCEPCRQQAQR